MDPIGLCFAESLRGIKVFQDIILADYLFKLKPQFLFLDDIIKWKDCQVDQLGLCFRSSLRG